MKAFVYSAGFILFIISLPMLAAIIDAALIAKRKRKKLTNSDRYTEQLINEEPMIGTEFIQEDMPDEEEANYSYKERTPEVFDTLRDK